MRYLLLTLLVLSASLVSAQTYKWEDKYGTIHFTDNLNEVPKKQRARAEAEAIGDMRQTPAQQARDREYDRRKAVADYNEQVERAARAQAQAAAAMERQKRQRQADEERRELERNQPPIDLDVARVNAAAGQSRERIEKQKLRDIEDKLDRIDSKLRYGY